MAQSKLMTRAIYKMVYYLLDEGIKIINKARHSKDTEDRTGTQYDSYGLAVFYNGKLYYSLKVTDPSKDSGLRFYLDNAFDEQYGRHKGWDKYGIPDGTGREWAKMFVDEIKGSNKIPKTGFALVIFNAAFYSNIQEGGKWQILSQVVTDIKELKAKFKGSTITPIGNITIT